MLQGPGENAGVLDLGEGEAVCFKVESHNHPSAVEPFQGAATGVGGILRDIIAMGARPIALLDGLRFGPGDPRFDRAVAGIGAYGNSVGVPTVGGEAVFDEAYSDNVLVNAMCVGLLPADRIARAGATGPGNLVVLYGATTGRDGIGGASVLASQELGEDDADKRPTVQVGDPFMGKKLIEVSVELVESGLVESLQDCGAAGLASSLSEMARECGIDLRLDQVPLREEGMEPWEVMISESQERMVAVVRPQMLEHVLALCERWELHNAVDRRGHRHRSAARALGRRGRRRDPGAAADRRVPALHRRAEAARRARRGTRAGRTLASGGAARAARRDNVRSRAHGLPALRPSRRLAHRPAARAGRRRAAAAAGLPRSRRLARRHRPDGASRPAHRRPTGGARGSAQRRLHGRRADRPDRLPQLRQPGEGRRSRGSWSSRSRGWRKRARRWGSRSSRATSRSTTRPTGARSIRHRSSAASGCSRTSGACLAPGARETSSCSPAPRRSRSPAPSTRPASARSAAGRHASTWRPRRR